MSSHSNSQSYRPSKTAGTPMTSPRQPYSVGQQYPPKLSPTTGRVPALDVRTPSPNYFALTIEPVTDPRDSARENWSPPTSSVKSFAAAIPKQLPLDANPEFEAFRRQIDVNRGRGAFNLSGSHFGASNQIPGAPSVSTPSAAIRPRAPRWHTQDSETPEASLPRVSGLAVGNVQAIEGAPSAVKSDADADSLHDSAYVSADSKRNSAASLNPPPLFLNLGRHESPAQFDSPFTVPEQRWSNLHKVDDRHPRLSMVPDRPDPPTPEPNKAQRADTVPVKLDPSGPSMMAPIQLKELLEKTEESEILLLDLRVSPQYAQSRIKGALNLCIPTTLLKRATFDLEKLRSTFQADREQEKFANWQKASHLVVYDAFSSERRDAVSAMNMMKKFANEGYSGSMNILRGGFNTFSVTYPHLIDRSSGNSPASLSLTSTSNSSVGRPKIAPIIGGVMLPTAGNNPNPFFGNIRQNEDLVGGVGQMDIGVPTGLECESLPKWLKDAAEPSDHGRRVSEKFLHIELAEQSRMRNAYSAFKPTGGGGEDNRVQLSGIEKGGKNRYRDILPFEHARVRLEGRPEGSCDYVNASHLKSSRSHKRYIASQGPLPATFEDFWSVIWEQDVRVIVMLTAESEGGQLKCHPYWTGKEFGPIRLHSLSEKKVSLDIDKHRSNSTATSGANPWFSQSSDSSSSSSADPSHSNSFSWNSPQAEVGRRRANTTTSLESSTPTPAQPNLNGHRSSTPSEMPYVIIRKFALSHAAHPFAPIREVTHLHYPLWPDFGAPAQPSHLLALVELANVMQRAALPIDVPGALASAASSTIQTSNGAVGNEETDGPRRWSGKRVVDTTAVSWHDAPESSEHVRPMLVHCSAGCGRTGTFCTVDSVIDMLKRQTLRAARQAKGDFAEKGKKSAQQVNEQAREKLQSAARKDVDGDVPMGDGGPAPLGGEAVSPLATLFEDSTASFPSPDAAFASSRALPASGRRSATPHGGDGDSDWSGDVDDAIGKENGIDTSWIDCDTVDFIAATVEDFRGQRLSMVQSLGQFVLCYETVIEWIWRLRRRGDSAGVSNIGSANSTDDGRRGGGGGIRGRARSGSLAM